WLGLGLSMGLLGGLVGSLILAARRPAGRGVLLVLVVAAVPVFAAYTMITGPVFWFCKYYIIAMPLAAAVTAAVIGASGILRPTREEVIAIGVATLACLGWMVFRERDAALLPEATSWLGMNGRRTVVIAAVFLLVIGALL